MKIFNLKNICVEISLLMLCAHTYNLILFTVFNLQLAYTLMCK